jgi:hypothetical protein
MTKPVTKEPTRKSLEEIEDARLNIERLPVFAQPHRNGERGDMTDVFGTFLRFSFGPHEQDHMRRCWEAGQTYIRKVARLRRVKGIPQKVVIEDETPSCGNPLDEKIVAAWQEEIEECEKAMKKTGLLGFRAANDLILYEIPPTASLFSPIRRAIIELAICLGTISVDYRK